MKATQDGNADCVRELLCAGVDPKAKDKFGNNPLLEASQRGNADVMKVLLAHRADVDVVMNNGNTPLHRAVVAGQIDVVNAGNTPLHEAVFYAMDDILQVLVARGADVNAAYQAGWTPMYMASKSGNVGIVKLLLDAGASMHSTTKDGITSQRNDTAEAGDEAALGLDDSAVYSRLDECHNHGSTRVYLIKEAIERIQDACKDSAEMASNIISTAREIFATSLMVSIQRESVLATTLMVERVLYKILKEIHNYWEFTLLKSQPLKVQLDNSQQLAAIKAIRSDIICFQHRLRQATEEMNICLDIQVVGTFEDVHHDIGKMVENMHRLDEQVQSIMQIVNDESKIARMRDSTVQIQRGFEHYEHQVALGNIQRAGNFEN
ncbi:hypothetical protein AC1031_013998 [Aphanomyces cochlioides]|nr:hypothetical protein AC1031_013998 [Aphanomyces cochlioides]